MAYGARSAGGPSGTPFVQTYGRPPFPSQSPVFAAPTPNGQGLLPPGSLTTSPNAGSRGFGAPGGPDGGFDLAGPSLGVGYPGAKGSMPNRVSSADDPFRAPGGPAPIGQRVGSQPPSLYGDGLEPDAFHQSQLDPIAPIGRRPTFDQSVGGPAQSSGSAGSSALRSPSPAQPDQVFGSAALGDDDEIVQPAARRAPPPGIPAAPGASWGKIPPPPAPGAGRWSAAPPSIWGMDGPAASPWSRSGAGFGGPPPPGQIGAPGLPDFGLGAGGVPPLGGEALPPLSGTPGRRQPSFGAPGGGQGYSQYPPGLFGGSGGPHQHQ